MPIELRESGGAGPSFNLGGAIQATTPSEVAGQWYNNADDSERVAGSIKYRCFYVLNTEATDLVSGQYEITTNTPNADTDVAIAAGSSGVNGVEQTVPNEDTSPSAVTFGTSPIALPTIPAGQHHAFWWRWTINPGATAGPGDNALTTVSGEV